MKKQISPQDWETLSAYLDGQQKPGERDRLEVRLQGDADLKAALVELQRTRDVLRASPRLHAPRNFQLKPEMVGVSRGTSDRLFPAFRLASAFATLLFIMVVLGDITGIGRDIFKSQRNVASQPMEFAAQEELPGPYPEIMMVPAPAEPAEAQEMLIEEPVAEKEIPAEESAMTESLAIDISGADVEETPDLGGESGFAPATEPPLEKAGEPAMDAATVDEQNLGEEEEGFPIVSEESVRDDVMEKSQGELLTGLQESVEYPMPEIVMDRETVSSERWPLIRVFEAFLGVVVIAFVAITIYLYRQTH